MLYLLVSSIISHHRWFAFDGARGVNDLLCTVSVNVHAIQSLLLPCANRWSSWSQWFLSWFGVHAEICLTCVCIVCVLFQGDKGILSFSLYDCLCLCARLCPRVPHNIHTEMWCPMCHCLCAQLYHTERCVCCPLSTVRRAAPTQTNDASLGPTSLGRGHENDVSLPVSQSPTFCSRSQLRFAKMMSGSVSVASCSDRRKKSLSQLRLQEQSVMNLFKWESHSDDH